MKPIGVCFDQHWAKIESFGRQQYEYRERERSLVVEWSRSTVLFDKFWGRECVNDNDTMSHHNLLDTIGERSSSWLCTEGNGL